ncbi:AI-2E family transporter [Butyricicoccus sp. Marseille-Q5471]|uniref:AI-2E family transporter n=1 Tax=Butyricicoccus sp. Marseille-Q5471 TaxID=3039493 RepID=UPI0024BC0059|nr:AI-2E family transporter [Butyricicoccus sp. Marseille-Q5471]
MRDPFENDSSQHKDGRSHYFQWGLTAFCVIGACILVAYLLKWLPGIYVLLKKLLKILEPFIYGFVMAYLLLPIFNWLYDKLKPWCVPRFKNGIPIAKGVSSALSLLSGIAVVGGLLWMVIPQLVLSIFSLLDSMDSYLAEISNWVAALLKDNPVIERNFMTLYDQLSDQIIGWVQNIAPKLVELMTGVMSTVSVLFNIFVGVIIALYILNSKDTFCAQAKKAAYSLMPIPYANRVLSRVNHLHRVLGGFITGKLIDSLIIGLLCFVVLSIMNSLGVFTISEYLVLISVIIGVTNIIPFFGPFIGAIPSGLLIAVISPVQALYFALFVLALQQFDGNILGPKILGDSTGLTSFWVMFAILVFGGIFGFVGMAVGVPLFAVLYSILTDRLNNLLKKKGLPISTTAYRGSGRLDPNSHEFVDVQDEAHPVSKKERRHAAKEAEKAKKD